MAREKWIEEEEMEMLDEGEIEKEVSDGDDLSMEGGGTGSEDRGGSQIAIVLISLMLIIAGGIAGVVMLGTYMDDDDEKKGDVEESIDIISEDAGYDGIPFNFTADITGIDLSDTVITWDFGDGETGSGPTLEHTFQNTGIYTVKITITRGDDMLFSSEKMVTVAPATGPVKGLLPDGRIPGWNLEFTGSCGEGIMTLLDIVASPDLIREINLTLEGEDRSFVGVDLIELFDLAGIRFDAAEFTIHGDSDFTSDVFTTLNLPINGGNATYIILIEDGKWISKTELNSTYMLVTPDGDTIENVHTIHIEQFELEISGKGIEEEITLNLDQIYETFELAYYNISDGREMYHFTGYPIWPILEYVSIQRNSTEVTFTASDGYSVDFRTSYLHDNPESDEPFFLAISEEGSFFDRSEGPFMLVTPDSDYLTNPVQPWYKQFWVKQVSSITVDADENSAPDLPWGDPVEAVLNITWEGGSYSITSSDLATHFDLMVEAECTKVKKTGTIVTDDFIGIPLFDLLDLAGAPENYGGLTFIASDGYSKTADPWTIYQGSLDGNVTMVALTEGGEWISQEDGGLMIAGSPLESKYWVSNLAEIHIEEWALEVNGETITIGELKAGDGLYSGNASKLKSDNTTSNITGSGVVVYNLLNSRLNITGMNNVTFFSIDDMNITISLSDLELRSAWNVSAFLAWEIDGEGLTYHSGLLRLILPDETNDGDDWTSKLWLKGVIRIEVTA